VRKIDKRRRPRDASQPVAAQGFVAGESARTLPRRRWWLLAILGLVFVAYSSSFHGALIFDNSGVVAEDPRIREATLQNIKSILHGGYWPAGKAAGLYRPFTTFSYLLNYAVLGNGPDPTGYHLVNLLLHEVNVVLVYALGVLIFGEAVPALALAAIWGLHPVLTESVANIVGRADLLAAFGVLAGLLCYARGSSAEGQRRIAWLVGLVIAQTVGLFSKESAVVLPGIMLLYDLTSPGRAAWRRRAPAYAAVASSFAVFLYLRVGSKVQMIVDPVVNPLVSAGFWTARLTAVKVIGKFLWLFLWPAYLSADYSFNAVPIFGWRATNWEDIKALIALAVCLGAVVLAVLLAVRGRGAWKPLFFFLGFFFVALSPVSNLIIFIGAVMAERFLYLPSVGLAGCVVVAFRALSQRSLKRPGAMPIAWAALGLVCLAFAARTYARNFDWEDDRSLWSSAVIACPESAAAHYNLGAALSNMPERRLEAIAEYQAALGIRPDFAAAHFNLGSELVKMPERLPEAIAEYQAALRIEPNFAEGHYNLGNALAKMPGRLPEAIAEYRVALRIDPDFAEGHYNLGNALAKMPGRLPEAIAEYQAALRIQPDFAAAHTNIGNALAGMPGRQPEAIAEYRAALRLRPDFAEGHYNLGNALARMPELLPEAIAEYQAALRIDPDFAPAHFNLGNALVKMPERLPEAIAEYQAVLRIAPDFVEAHTNLGWALAQTPARRPEAIAEYEAALRIKPDPQVRQLLDRLRAGH
jgi:tetratricopeptide (TPR) repeat protein